MKNNNSILAKRKGRTKKKKKKVAGNVVSQKRFVSAVKVFLTDAEKEAIREKVGNFGSVSNYIRHHLGLPINTVGRKKRYTESALDLKIEEMEKEILPPAEDFRMPERKPDSSAGRLTEEKTRRIIKDRQITLWDAVADKA